MPSAVTLEPSSARAGLAVGSYMCCLLLPPTPPACPPQSSSLQKPWFQRTLLWEAKLIFFLITPVICQLLAQTSPNTALPAAGSDPLFSSCFREEMDWSIYLSRASSVRERQAGFLLLRDLVIYLALCPALGHIYCLNKGGKAEILFFVLLPSDHLRNWALQHSRSLVFLWHLHGHSPACSLELIRGASSQAGAAGIPERGWGTDWQPWAWARQGC